MKLGKDELPRHFEAAHLKPWVAVAGWPLAAVTAAAGVALAAGARPAAVEGLGVMLAALAALLIAGLVRCRSYEIVVGRRLISFGVGPFRRRIPVGMVASADARPAGSWRRLYADGELELSLADGRGQLILPSREPRELTEALKC